MMAFLLDDPKTRDPIARSIPIQRIAEPEDMAGAAIHLCSRAGAFVSRHTLADEGGLLLGPA